MEINRKKIVLNAFLIWTFWALFYGAVFKFQENLPWFHAIFISFNINYTYALLSLLIWRLCRRIPFHNRPLPGLLFTHFGLAILFSALWLFITYGAWYLKDGPIVLEYVNFRAIVGWQFLFGLITYLLIAGVFYTLIYYRQFREKEMREAELQILSREAELKALKMQINPHFLFNTLNSVNALVKGYPDEAREMIGRLSDLLRLSLESRDRTQVPLREELDFARLYLDIEKIRFKDRMKVRESIEPALMNTPFPAMILQPLLENAVKHGIAAKRGKGEIQLTLSRKGQRVICGVANSVGDLPVKREGNGTGLANIRQRLSLLFGEHFEMHVDASQAGWFQITLSWPIQEAL